MKRNELMSWRAFSYLFITKFLRSTTMFTFFVASFAAMMLTYGLLAATSYADPLFTDDFNWIAAAQPLFIGSLLAGLFYSLLSSLIYRYSQTVRLEDVGVEIESGVLLKKIDIIPYSQIKYVEQRQSPLQRLLNFASLSIDYGGWNPQIVEHISQDQAEELQSLLAHEVSLAQ